MRCSDCSKTCTTPESLRHHAYDHSVGDRFACKNCGEKFVFKSYLKVHLLKHKGKPTFTCPIVNCKKNLPIKGNWLDTPRNMKMYPGYADVVTMKQIRKESYDNI